jgi:hypothetical protein
VTLKGYWHYSHLSVLFLELIVVAFYHGYHGCGQPDFAFVLGNSKSGSEI